MTKIVIFIMGGLIHNIVTDGGPAEVFVVDYDTDGVDDDHPCMTKLDGDDCLLCPYEVGVQPDRVALVKKTWETV